MGCHVYVYDKKHKEIMIPAIRVSMDHEDEVYKTQSEALAFVENVLLKELDLKPRTDCCDAHKETGIGVHSYVLQNLECLIAAIKLERFGCLQCG